MRGTKGSAEFDTIMMSALADQGCDATDEALLTVATAHLDQYVGESFAGSSEPYELGVLSGLLLAGTGSDAWYRRVQTGTPPLEILLENVMALPQSEDPSLQLEVQTAVAERNDRIGMEIDPMLDRMASAQHYRIPVNFNWLVGSFRLQGFYYLANEPGNPEVYVSLSATFRPPSGKIIETMEHTVLVGVPTPCQLSTAMVVTVPIADVQYDAVGGLLTSTWSEVAVSGLQVEEIADDSGLVWLCPVDAGGAPLSVGPRTVLESSRPSVHPLRHTDLHVQLAPQRP